MAAQRTRFESKVGKRSSGMGLFEYLEACIPSQTPQQWRALVASGEVCVGEQVVKEDRALEQGDRISYWIDDYQEPEVPLDWSILWRNAELLALHKPAGLPVSRTTRNIRHNLISLVRQEAPWEDAHLLHRLDKETSGIILLAHTKAMAQHWQPKLSDLLIRKVYRAIVYGIPAWEQKTYSCLLTTKLDSPIRCQMHVDDHQGKLSTTLFTVVEPLGKAHSIVECELVTGRKHQIRAQLAELGHPIVGDKIYAHQGQYYLKRCEDRLTEQDWAALGAPHHLLHAQRVQLSCASGLWIEDESYPAAWNAFIQSIHR